MPDPYFLVRGFEGKHVCFELHVFFVNFEIFFPFEILLDNVMHYISDRKSEN